MENNTIDNLFREKIERINDLPENVSWNSDKGWKEYRRQYLYQES